MYPELSRGENGEVTGINTKALALLFDAVQQVQALTYPTNGVCYNVHALTRDSGVSGYDAMHFLAKGWPHARRFACGAVHEYFIPENPQHDMWAGPNWRMRHDFMEYALRRIETMLKAQEGTDA